MERSAAQFTIIDPEGSEWTCKASLTKGEEHAINVVEEDAGMRLLSRLAKEGVVTRLQAQGAI